MKEEDDEDDEEDACAPRLREDEKVEDRRLSAASGCE